MGFVGGAKGEEVRGEGALMELKVGLSGSEVKQGPWASRSWKSLRESEVKWGSRVKSWLGSEVKLGSLDSQVY